MRKVQAHELQMNGSSARCNHGELPTASMSHLSASNSKHRVSWERRQFYVFWKPTASKLPN